MASRRAHYATGAHRQIGKADVHGSLCSCEIARKRHEGSWIWRLAVSGGAVSLLVLTGAPFSSPVCVERTLNPSKEALKPLDAQRFLHVVIRIDRVRSASHAAAW